MTPAGASPTSPTSPTGPTGPIALAADTNKNGEIAGAGPEWVCKKYGQPDHDYFNCRTCWGNFDTFLGAGITVNHDHKEEQQQ